MAIGTEIKALEMIGRNCEYINFLMHIQNYYGSIYVRATPKKSAPKFEEKNEKKKEVRLLREFIRYFLSLNGKFVFMQS